MGYNQSTMKNIVKKFKKILSSKEVKDFKAEVKGSAQKLKTKAEEKAQELKATAEGKVGEAKKFAGKKAMQAKSVADDALDRAEDFVEAGVAKAEGMVNTAKNKAMAVGDVLTSDGLISHDLFSKVEVRVGTIMEVEDIPKSDKLYLLTVDLGEKIPRQIVSGIKQFYPDKKKLLKRQAMFVANLEPREIMGHTSQGMIFGVKDKGEFSILEPDTHMTPGTKAA